MSSFAFIVQQVSIYYGIPFLIGGLLGSILNVIVFLSLQTFRQSPCAFYLTIMSLVNVGQLSTGLLSRIMISEFNINWADLSPIYCKVRYFLLQTFTLISATCLCLATIDQYLTTCFRPRWRQWSRLKVAYHLTIGFSVFWSLHGILYLVFAVQVYSPVTKTTICTMINSIFSQYSAYGFSVILAGFLPIFITILFAVMAFRNIQQINYRTIPLVRRELDKQLTMMVLLQVIVNALSLLPTNITGMLQTNTTLTNNPDVASRLQFARSISLLFYYFNFASPFYIYICVSERFRRQFVYVIFEMHFNRCRQRIIPVNQIAPVVESI